MDWRHEGADYGTNDREGAEIKLTLGAYTVDTDKGKSVRIKGLIGKPELNGKVGEKISWIIDKRRYRIAVHEDRKVYSLKEENIESIEEQEEK